MTDHDVIVVTPVDESDGGCVDRSFAEQLVARAKVHGVDLVGPGGLLAGLTKQVLEAGLEVEMEDHVGYRKHAAPSPGRSTAHPRDGGGSPARNERRPP